MWFTTILVSITALKSQAVIEAKEKDQQCLVLSEMSAVSSPNQLGAQ